ncbi:MAG: aldo/keto reductase [Eubacteriales bacterium]|nr:aldo/keto reductase [Eubacteriales bacterium]
MKQVEIGSTGITASAIVQGCMRINTMTISEIEKLVYQDLENGINFFDHADCYTDGECERLFGEVLKLHPDLRNNIKLQTKCGILTGELYYFDFSKNHILKAVDESLSRLSTDYIDFLLLHRPDALVEPEDVAAAFDILQSSGKVLHFGVSNQNPGQMELLKKYVKQPLEINQLQFSIMHTGMIDEGFSVNTKFEGSLNHDGSVLNYCRLHDCTIQAWSPFQYGFFDGPFLDNPKFPELNKKISQIAEKYQVSGDAVAIAWILRHPANMQAVIGSTNLKRLHNASKAGNITLTRKEWYEIYHAAGNFIP